MTTHRQAKDFIQKVYREVWQPYSAANFSKHYDKKLIARSGECLFDFDDFYLLLKNKSEELKYMRPQFHSIMEHSNSQLLARFTTIHYNHDNQEVYRINTMGNYTIKNDKIVSLEFLWDKPIDFVMRQMGPLGKNSANQYQKLTKRELQCFFYLIQGKSAKQIAELWKLSERTIETHIANIKDKLNLANLREIIDYAFANNLTTFSPLFTALLRGKTHE